MLLAKAIDGIYDSDPKTNPSAVKYDEITIQDVIDQKLADTTGLEIIMRLRASGVATPSVLITTNLPTHLRIRATTLAIPIVEKPLLTDALFATIRELIGGPTLGG